MVISDIFFSLIYDGVFHPLPSTQASNFVHKATPGLIQQRAKLIKFYEKALNERLE